MRYGSGDSLYPNPYRQLPPERNDPVMEIVKPVDLPEEKQNLHPEGTFKAVVVACEAKMSQNGNQMLVATFKTDHGKLKYYMVYQPTKRWALERFYSQLATLGVTLEFVEAADDWDEVALNCIKGEALINVSHQPGREEGKTLVQVDSIESVA